MAKKILTVGCSLPGGDCDSVAFTSSRSLLDADIILFSPEIPYARYTTESYQGKPCLSDDSSFRAKDAIAHWRREIGAALNAGKLVVVLLQEPEVVFAATGEKQYSGTGRNARATRIVGQLSSYEALPVSWKFLPASGNEIAISQNPESRFFMQFWAEFSNEMNYELYLEGELKHPLLRTKSGERVVGAAVRKGKGALVAIPPLNFEDPDFTEIKGKGDAAKEYWTKKGVAYGKKLMSALCALSVEIASESNVTAPPDWTKNDSFQLAGELEVLAAIETTNQELQVLDDRKRELDEKLLDAGSLRALLFEQGKPLEKAVLEALNLFGFNANSHNQDGSEFDAIFSSAEGRFLGEVEGKDSKAINIDKFSQLERNLSEDFQREEVTEHAKGVLFGNPFRLRPPDEREQPFTAKCITAAERLKVALVNTPDLFGPARYLKYNQDPKFATLCRLAIYETSGKVVVFPEVPESK